MSRKILNRRLETPEELASGMDDRPPADALLYFVDWLNRSDHLSDKIATDYLAASLEALAAALRAEVIENSSSSDQRAGTCGDRPAGRG
jgi:hypothetical protein